MAKKESVQKRLQKVRPPRVQLTYDVEKGDAIEQKELPFVVGVVGDLMRGLEPRAAYRVKNRLTDEGGTFGVDLKFRSVEDFRPEAVVQQIEPLKELLDIRTKLADLRNKLAGNDKLEDLLGEVLSSTEKLQQLTSEAGKNGKGGSNE
jgi:type VI secretion system protein ImpB